MLLDKCLESFTALMTKKQKLQNPQNNIGHISTSANFNKKQISSLIIICKNLIKKYQAKRKKLKMLLVFCTSTTVYVEE